MNVWLGILLKSKRKRKATESTNWPIPDESFLQIMETEAGLLIWCDLSFSSMLAANNGAPFSHSSLSAATDLFVSHCAATYQAHVWNESPFSGHDYCFLQNPSFERVRIGIKSLAALSSLQMSYIFCICMLLPSRHLTEISLMLVSHPHCSFFSLCLYFYLDSHWDELFPDLLPFS